MIPLLRDHPKVYCKDIFTVFNHVDWAQEYLTGMKGGLMEGVSQKETTVMYIQWNLTIGTTYGNAKWGLNSEVQLNVK